LANLEIELNKISGDSLPSATSLFCPHRNIAITVCVALGKLTYWQLWPANSIDEINGQHAMIETQSIMYAAMQSSRESKH
jgi:hypothetical protein